MQHKLAKSAVSKSAASLMLAGAAAAWSACAQPSAPTIQPGAIWLDDRGRHIQAHGGGIIKLGDTWYWFGEDRSQDNDPTKRYVACYASSDLVHWKFRNSSSSILAFGALFPEAEAGRDQIHGSHSGSIRSAARVSRLSSHHNDNSVARRNTRRARFCPYRGHSIEGLLSNSRMVLTIFDD